MSDKGEGREGRTVGQDHAEALPTALGDRRAGPVTRPAALCCREEVVPPEHADPADAFGLLRCTIPRRIGKSEGPKARVLVRAGKSEGPRCRAALVLAAPGLALARPLSPPPRPPLHALAAAGVRPVQLCSG